MWEPPEPEEAERQAAGEFWEEQARLPLRERNQMWWAAVALPTTILVAWVVTTILWIVGVL